MTHQRTVAPATDAGSPELAAALAAGDREAVLNAVQLGWVVIPVLRSDTNAVQLRAFDGLDPQRPGLELPLFSSVATLNVFLAEDQQREFEFVRGSSLGETLANSESLIRVLFDPAGPHAMAADVDEIITALARAPRMEAASQGVRDSDRALDLDLPLGDDWLRIDLTATEEDLAAQVQTLVERQVAGLAVGAPLRIQLAQWLRRLARTATQGGGRETAFLVRRTDDAALALSVTRYWQRLGSPPKNSSHLDAVARRISTRHPEGKLVAAQLPAGRLIRQVRVDVNPALTGADPIPVLSVDYWLDFPDHRGVCLVAFSSPHVDLEDNLLSLTDEIVASSTWLIATKDHDDQRRIS